jgi:hypothetical protein
MIMRWIYLVLGVALLTRAEAQQALPGVSPVPLPRGPLLNRAPGFAQWLKSTKNEAPDTATIPDQSTKYDVRELVKQTGDVRYEITVTGTVSRTEKWCEGNYQAIVIPGQQPAISARGGSEMGGNFTDYSKTDFPDFAWVTKRNYAGVETIEGVDCLVFHKADENENAPGAPVGPAAATSSASSAAPSIPQTGDTAFIDLKSRLPVLIHVAGATTLYQFEPPPTAMQALPANLQEAFDFLEARQKRAAFIPPAG